MNKMAFKNKLIIMLAVSNLFFGACFAGEVTQVFNVIDSKVEDNTGIQVEKMQNQLDSINKEIQALKDGNFHEHDITDLMNEVNGLIKQASSESYDYDTQFSTNYKGYQKDILGAYNVNNYEDFYKKNANITLNTINDANKAIEDDKQQNNVSEVNTTIDSARANLLNGDKDGQVGTTQAISSVAEINIEILKQLESMHAQLAAMTEAQNAVAAKKIQEEATEKAQVRKELDANAVPVEVKYGTYSLDPP
jgi:hypothetical protein